MSGRLWNVFVTDFDSDDTEQPETHLGQVDQDHVDELTAIARIKETPRHRKESMGNVDETFYILHSDGNGCLERYTPVEQNEEA